MCVAWASRSLVIGFQEGAPESKQFRATSENCTTVYDLAQELVVSLLPCFVH